MIYERLDVVVWATTLLVFVLLGARAWAVETAGAQLYRTAPKVRVLTIGSWLAVIALVVLLAVQGGVLLAQSIITRTDPSDVVTVVPANPPPPAPVDPNAPPAAPADPNAPPPADTGAPPADAPVDPAAPAG
ncbi:hypothetical protein [Pseudonocardia kunmingensis]|uniref:Uncharacterized protein n=1 Tax=Pseudonocardia kunmingensis TaxID=630975 RepID=A0A543D3M8_9PSEU|nr:hypothetical protein [Pseudonocardia kunmingensis]TQM03939.1 hypothetical protein FB558_6964 [Pseudonocardia kunmingensis]